MANITVENGETYVLLDDSSLTATIDFVDSTRDKYGNAFWIFSCSGLHCNNPILIAVKNVHREADGDGESIWYDLTNDGLFGDDLTPLDDAVADWYSDAVMEVAKEMYEED